MASRRAERIGKCLSFLGVLLTPLLPLCCISWREQDGFEQAFSPGPLGRGHAHLQCKQCHVEPWRGGRQLVTTERPHASRMDQVCASCHAGLGTQTALLAGLVAAPPRIEPHHTRAWSGQHVGCATCHQEHQGARPALRTADRHCTSCHADLRPTDGPAEVHAAVTGFPDGHPAFGSRHEQGLRDPGNLHFNHLAHAQLTPEAFPHLAAAVTALNQQPCTFCHQPDPAGSGMRPVRYAAHCADCHPLAVRLAVLAETPAVRRFRQEPAPHLAPAGVRAALQERLVQVAPEAPNLVARKARRVPGPKQLAAGRGDEDHWVLQQLDEVERMLFDGAGGCRYCHVEQQPRRRAGELPVYEPTNVPGRWFPYAAFSHARHGLLSCTHCHESVLTSTRTAEVHLPGIEKCAECHASHREPRRRARSDCLECHRYHGR